MEQNAETSVPMTPVVESKQKNGNGLKIVTAIACIVAVCSIGFGVYGMIQSSQKDSQISDLKVQIKSEDGTITELETDKIKISDDTNTITITDDNAVAVDNLYLAGNNVYTKRHYYLGITDLDPSKDSREVDTYLIDTTKLGTKDGVSKFDIKTILDKIVDEKVASLPDVLSPGTQNATQKSSCKSFSTRIGDATDNPLLNKDWTILTDWSNLIPMTVYMQCIINDGNVISYSLGTDLYALNPQTGETTKLVDDWN